MKDIKTNYKVKYPFPDVEDRYKNASMSEICCLNENQSTQLGKWIQDPKHFLYIHSQYGTGKTHLSSAIALWYHERNLPIYYFNEHKLFTMTDSEESEGRSASWKISTICENPFVVWDDLCSTLSHFKNSIDDGKKKTLMKQFIHDRYEKRLPTIITTNYTPEELNEIIDGRISSRIRATENLILEVIGPDRRQEGL